MNFKPCKPCFVLVFYFTSSDFAHAILQCKARFAHLCTVMSRMHHRREGYPFGSLVDFAPDLMGRKLMEIYICFLYLVNSIILLCFILQ